MYRGIFLLAVLVSLSSSVKGFQLTSDDTKQIQAYQLDDQEQSIFRFDGKLDESFWGNALPTSGFLQQSPVEGNPATEKTEVKITYDDKYLYIGVILYDSDPSQIKAFQKRRDQRITADE